MNSKKNLKRNLLICLLAGSAVMYTLPLHAATSVIGNGTLPTGENSLTHNHTFDRGNLEMTIKQNGANGVITWNDFSVGGSATVNFEGNVNGYNTLNYVNGGNMSQIYGTINANNNGNIFIVNPAGVQIGNSAQINVGSLYVSNKYLNEDKLGAFAGTITPEMINATKNADAALMSLGNINANNVTFEGNGRIVIDSERIKNAAGSAVNNDFEVHTNDAGNVLIGYDAYNEIVSEDSGTVHGKGTYEGKQKTFSNNVYVNGKLDTTVKGYMWVEDVKQLQAINTNLSGNYALRNSIDATSTEQNDFTSIGSDDSKAFTGNFDGLDYSIFDLNIDETGNDNVGLFGYTTDATISNVTLVGGSIRGNNNVGAVVGNANNTTVTNALNSAAVSGNSNVGGIVGSATNTTVEDAINTGAIEGRENTNGGSNVGGLIGSMNSSHLIGNSYNLGDVTSIGSNVGGLVGSASNSTIGNPSVVNGKPVENIETVYNRMDVTGDYNVGGIVGNMVGSTVRNAENSGTVEATGYTTEDYTYHTAHYNDNENYTVDNVFAANAGGIVGNSSNNSTITDVLNTADVSSSQQSGNDYYDAGNVGGIVGKAVDTNITNATNQENEIRGAHNVGGIAGYFGNSSDDSSQDYTVTNGINDGGDIMATGARNAIGFVQEWVRAGDTGGEQTIVGNMGGIVGYLDGDNVYVTGSANRGTVHSLDIEDQDNISDASRASNTGGVVGKIDRSSTESLTDLQNGTVKAAVSDSYNTGDVRGYMGVGGIVGMMYNGEVVSSYNTGTINTTRQVGTNSGTYYSVNMGGIVGDTTEGTNAQAVIYDVYNEGQIGDETFTYYARHVGGIVGRLNGTVDKAYNTGDIYNGYNVVGGIAGWFYDGTISNSFNTGNITVVNNENTTAASQVGGIAGGVSGSTGVTIENAYNLGTLRSYYGNGGNSVGGIIGKVTSGTAAVNITNVYTTGNIYAEGQNGASTAEGLGSIYGSTEDTNIRITNGYYITPEDTNSFIDLNQRQYNNNQQGTAILYANRYDPDEYNFTFATQSADGSNIDESAPWRIYAGTTPILNAFLPNTEDYFSGETGHTDTMNGIDSIQYGTAYNPLLTIINANVNTDNLTFDWGDLGITGAASIAVYNSGLTLYNVDTSDGTGYYGGLLYSDGDLSLNTSNKDGEAEEDVSGNISLGSGAKLYGSSVAINADGTVTVYGSVTATGNEGASDITVNAGDVNVYGTLTSVADDGSTKVSGILGGAVNQFDFGNISNENAAATSIGDRFAKTVESQGTGSITITANGTKTVENDDGTTSTVTIGDGNVGLYYGNKGEGITTTGGNLTITGTGDVYVDSDLDIGGNLTLNGTGADSEVVLDITNIGQVQADNGTVTDALTGLHNFMHHFSDTDGDGNTITLSAENSGDAKLAVDMWDYEDGVFDLNKYDDIVSNGHTLLQELQNLNISASVLGEDDTVTTTDSAQGVTYIWVSDADQLNGIQEYYDSVVASGGTTNILSYNFALKNDINASDLTDYNVIGTAANGDVIGYSGTFDGRGNRIIGLEVDNEINAGIFSKINQTGAVKNLNVYSGMFTGTDTTGAIAGINNGTIENITAFGNTVTVTGDGGNAGGISGTNSGTVDDVESSGSVIAESDNVIVGGLVGTNESGATVNNSYSNSAVTSTSGTDAGLGGVVGVNKGTVSLVDSLGVTNGTNSTKVGGVIGINSGTLSSAYNESIVNGYSNVGGIIGDNDGSYDDYTDTWTGGIVENVVNATGVTGTGDYVGGLVGTNIGSVTNGRNNGTITGTNYVGGMVGSNAQGATLTNLVNDSSAAIEGENFVGGIAGTNAGTITAQNQSNLINRGSITGQNYVGGVAGENIGTIEYVKNDVNLYVKDDTKIAQYFGGVAGVNGRVDDTSTTEDEMATGTITSATNEGDVVAENAQYVGGIVGWNTVNGTLDGMGNSNTGRVEGATYVGGVAGKNDADITGTADNIITIENTGVVIAHKGGAGGIFGENTGDITYAEMSNSGIVSGTNYSGIDDVTNGTGGIIGVNSGDITYSSLKNEADGQVIGMENVGGLIGYNSGEITGGRTEVDDTDAGYYKYQIYNNGVINAGKWVDGDNSNEEGYGVIDSGEFTAATVNDNSKNIGGLIGNNAANGKLTAGYNTGAINAGSSTNVGGIAGSNAATIDQVFNTVMTENGQNQTITGGTNVGGLVGNNSGILSNAYNTAFVKGTTNVGNAVGENNSNISNVYDITNTDNKLIGSGNGSVTGSYSANGSDEDLEGITYVIKGDEFKENTYKDSLTGNKWKYYDGYSNPLLSVFLTKVTVDQDKVNEYMNANKVYNGIMQQLTADDIKNLIESGAVSVKGLTQEEAFEAFNNNNSLISSIGYKDVWQHNDWLYSGQIAETTGNTFNPNNLGYDIELTASIAQAELSISDILANIVYGGNTYTDIAGGSLTGIINNDDVYLRDKNGNKISITSDLIADYLSGDYAANKGNRNTADVKRDQNNNVIAYEDAISVDGISLGGTASGNYKLTDTTISGDITVTPATLNITLNDIYRIYGDHKTIYSNYDATQTGDYGIKNVSGLVNGDQDNLKNLIVKAISDGALDDYANPTKTNDVTKDGYKWTGEFSGIDNVNSNYTITVDGGNSIVKAKTITIKDLLASIVYGNQDNKGLQINTGASLADGSIVYGDDVRLVTDNAQYTTGGAYEDSRGNRTTADVGEYTDSLFVSGLSLTGDKAGNYVLDTTAAVGNIEVTKANLIINVGNAETVYGDAFNDNDYTHTLSGVTNGDSDTVIDGLLGGNYDNTVSVEAGKDTANAGTYKDALGFVNYQQLKNYDVQVENGDVIINKKQITIGVNDEQILVGETPNYSGTDIQEQLVNGDIISDDIYHYGVSADTDVNVAGEHNIGIYINGTYYELQNPDWSSENGLGFFANYNVTFEPGTLTVSAYDIPEDWPHNRWDYLFNDAPFDRNKDFRERKAEVNFVDGGMEI
jgi:filamentous hemagglutinin family protein